MVNIFKNNDYKSVTLGAYNSFYKPLGYKIVIESIAEEKEEVKPVDSKKVVTNTTKKVSSNNTKKEK